MKKVLIIDDDNNLRSIVKDVLKTEGFITLEAADGPDGIKTFKANRPDVVLLDLKMPEMDGLEVMQELGRINPKVPIIMLTGFGDIPTAVEAMRCGAFDFTIKPPEFEKLVATLNRAIERKELEAEAKTGDAATSLSLQQMFGNSSAVRTVIDQINQVANTDFSLIIQGETGTGKSFAANIIHNMSKRAKKPFVRVDMGLVPEPLVESELFGYRKGAFTGADRNKAGYFEKAHSGTIFIDELENMPKPVQCKLLTVIDSRQVYPLGSTTPVDTDVRIIAATNKNIRQGVNLQDFREDLFFRLGEFIITLPPLRERVDDIHSLAAKFLIAACNELDKQVLGLTDGAIDILMQHPWPGNLRELKNVIRKAALLTEGDRIGKRHIEFLFRSQSDNTVNTLRDDKKELEKKKIQEALAMTKGNKKKAAEILNIGHSTLYEKIKELGIS